MQLLKKSMLILAASFAMAAAQANDYSYPYQSYYCAKNFRNVSVGASMDEVRAACGDPTSTRVKQVQTQTPQDVTIWIYTLGLFSVHGATFSLPSLTITFSDNKVIAIAKDNMPITAGGYCTINGLVNMGDTMSSVQALCGQPNIVSTRQQMQVNTKEVTEWVYNLGPYQPQVIFAFEAGTLTQINMGRNGN